MRAAHEGLPAAGLPDARRDRARARGPRAADCSPTRARATPTSSPSWRAPSPPSPRPPPSRTPKAAAACASSSERSPPRWASEPSRDPSAPGAPRVQLTRACASPVTLRRRRVARARPAGSGRGIATTARACGAGRARSPAARGADRAPRGWVRIPISRPSSPGAVGAHRRRDGRCERVAAWSRARRAGRSCSPRAGTVRARSRRTTPRSAPSRRSPRATDLGAGGAGPAPRELRAGVGPRCRRVRARRDVRVPPRAGSPGGGREPAGGCGPRTLARARRRRAGASPCRWARRSPRRAPRAARRGGAAPRPARGARRARGRDRPRDAQPAGHAADLPPAPARARARIRSSSSRYLEVVTGELRRMDRLLDRVVETARPGPRAEGDRAASADAALPWALVSHRAADGGVELEVDERTEALPRRRSGRRAAQVLLNLC